jgi:autotransporter passenger strand-loop-strand repeat protein
MISGTGTTGIGVELGAGGSVGNSSTITGGGGGVYILGGAGTVDNSGMIAATGTNGEGVYLAAGGTVTNSGILSAGINGVLVGAGVGTIINSGTIATTDSNTGAAIALHGGGYVDNAGGTLSGYNNAVFASGSAGTVANSGTITSQNGPAVDLLAGGSVSNETGGQIVQTSTDINGIGVFLGFGGTVSNSGTISAATASNGAAVRFGTAGGRVSNSGLVTAYHDGVGFFPGTAANPGTLSVVNYGTIVSTQQSTAASTGFSGFAIQTGTGGIATIDNFGTIAAMQTLGGSPSIGGAAIGVAGGLVNNEAGATIEAVDGNAVAVGAAAGNSALNVDNSGTIENIGSSHSAIYLGHGGVVTNRAGAVISSSNWNAVSFDNTLTSGASFGSVVNSGTIISTGTSTGTGVRFGQGGSLTDQASGSISAYRNGVSITGSAGTVTNLGTIRSTGTYFNGVYLGAGGTVTNAAGGTIVSGWQGVNLDNVAGTVTNYGSIVSTASVINSGSLHGNAVHLGAGGLVVNGASGALIAGYEIGVTIGIVRGVPQAGAVGTVVNYGTIANTGTDSTLTRGAVRLGAAGSIINHGLIESVAASAVAILGTDGATIANFGTIVGTGGTAISLGGGADLVVLEKGSVLSGAIAGFAPGDTLDLAAVPFSPSDTVTFDGTILTVSGGGVSESVALAGIAAGADFILQSDAQGDAQLVPVASGSNLVVSSGQVLTVLAGQNVSNVTVESGGVFDVASGGAASGATIQSGGLESVFAGGTDSGATVSSGGFEDVFGSAVAILVLNGGSQTVEAGGTVSAVVLDGAGLETVSGFAGGTVVGSGDEELVASGGVASGSVISSGGSEIVLSGGLTSDTTIAGGALELEAGALASGLISFTGGSGILQLDSLASPEAAVAGLMTGDTIDFREVPFAGSDTVAFDGTVLTVSGGGVSESVRVTGLGASSVFLLRSDGNGGSDAGLVPASGAVVSAGEVLHISAGETLSGVTVLSGGVLEVDAGGAAVGTMVSSGGEELVEPGGTDSAAVISSGGFEDVFGSASATLVLNGGSQTVEAGGSVTGAVLDGVGLQTVSGVATGTVVSAGDEQLVTSGGAAIGTTVLSGGLLVVASGGVASGAVIGSGGEAVVSAGGVDRGAVVSGGGVEEAFGSAGGTVVLSGGEQLVEPGGSASGTVISQGGFEEVLGGVTSDTTIAGGELEVTTGAVAEGVIGFGGVVGTLRLDSLATPGATLVGVAAGDVIDLPLLSFAASDTVTLGQNNLLTVSGGGESVSLQFDASVAGKGFALSDDGSGGALLTLTPQMPQAPQASLFDFVFVYNGGQDYYLGRVADDGRFGYSVGETKTNAAGSYIVFGEESAAASAAVGSVFVDYYSHGGPGAASGIPVKTAAGSADGTAGLGSESDTLLGLDGAGHAFSSTAPAVFATTALFGFVFTYADGAAYSGTVADNTPGGLPGSRTVTGGVYTIFREGVTSRPSGSVVIDRFVANGLAVLANHASPAAVDGRNGLGSEVGSVTVGSVNHAFGPGEEPVVTGSAPTEPAASTPPVSDVIANEVDRIFVDILGRFPSQGEFDATGGELGAGTSTADVRAALAGGSEASGDVAGLYRQVFGRAATAGEISGATGMLSDGGSLASLQQQLANSSEAASDINQAYRDILGHDADPSGLAGFVAALGDETPGHLTDPGGLAGLAGARDVLAHSGQAEDALTSLFQTIIGRAPSTAELVGMEDRLVTAGTTEATLKNALSATGSAGGFTTIAAPGGNASLSAPSGPSLFQFSDVAFNDTITGFDAGRDTIQLPKAVAADFPTVKGDTTGISGGSLITLSQNQSIFLAGLPPAKLAAGNFLLL